MPETTQSDLVERLRDYAPSDGIFIRCHDRSTRQMNADIRKAADELERLRAHCEALEKAMAPFLNLGPQRGAWGVISKKLDDFAPMTVTVTKAQILEALAAYKKENPT